MCFFLGYHQEESGASASVCWVCVGERTPAQSRGSAAVFQVQHGDNLHKSDLSLLGNEHSQTLLLGSSIPSAHIMNISSLCAYTTQRRHLVAGNTGLHGVCDSFLLRVECVMLAVSRIRQKTVQEIVWDGDRKLTKHFIHHSAILCV